MLKIALICTLILISFVPIWRLVNLVWGKFDKEINEKEKMSTNDTIKSMISELSSELTKINERRSKIVDELNKLETELKVLDKKNF